MRTNPKLRLLLAAAVGLMALAMTGLGGAVTLACSHAGETSANLANGANASDPANCVVEPILSKKDGTGEIYVNDSDVDGLGIANIKSFVASSGGGQLSFTATMARNVPTGPCDFVAANAPCTGGGSNGNVGTGLVRAPYGGVHILTLFKTDWLGQVQVVGTNSTTGVPIDSRAGSPGDNIHWFLGYGITASHAGNPDCNFGVYNPDTVQLFSVGIQKDIDPPITAGQRAGYTPGSRPTIDCVVGTGSNGLAKNQVRFTVPYVAWDCPASVTPGSACFRFKTGDPTLLDPTTTTTVIGSTCSKPTHTVPTSPTASSQTWYPGCAVNWGALGTTFTNADLLANTTNPVFPTGRNGTRVYELKAFSWMDHEVGGPPPVGLLIGATWYTDSLPSASYKQGTPSQDPFSGLVAIPATCARRASAGGVSRSSPAGPVNVPQFFVKNPLFAGLYGQCYQPIPVGPLMQGGLSFTAAP